MLKKGQKHRFFAAGFILRPVAGWVLVAAILVLAIVIGITQITAEKQAAPLAKGDDGTDLVLRIRGLPYAETTNDFSNGVAMSEAQLLIRTRLVTGEDGISRLIIDARLVSGDGQNIWSKTSSSENTGVESVQEEIGRTLTEAMQHVGVNGDRISI